MNWKPKTEEEIQTERLCPEGLQPFTIIEAAVVESKSVKNAGKEMLKLKLNVHADDGDYHVYDYVAPWIMEHKFRHLFFCVGRGADYEAGTTNTALMVGLEGWADVGHQKGQGNFGPKAVVRDYKPQETTQAAPKPQPAKPAPEEDDVPF